MLGAGAYGAVYEAKLNSASCIAKRLHDILTGTSEEACVCDKIWRASSQECALLSKMRHPNVVQFLRYCTDYGETLYGSRAPYHTL